VDSVTAKVESANAAANAASSAAAASAAAAAAKAVREEESGGRWFRSMPAAGVQQVPEAPIFSGATMRDRRVFMDAYTAYVRRLAVLYQGSDMSLRLMPLAACIDPTILPRVCELEMGGHLKVSPRKAERTILCEARSMYITTLKRSIAP
jgi:hypothetical protein